ncbi:hypothetical protein C8J56DRAFT_890433 [Mycena floridula]|nr:hypothetical protein C8J56DRAFT_890433 [Mycena floridula]
MLASRLALSCEICLGCTSNTNNPEWQTLSALSKLGTDDGIDAPTEVPPAKEAKGYTKGAENKRGGVIVHIGKMIRKKERDPKLTQNQRQRRSLTYQEHDQAADRGCKDHFCNGENFYSRFKSTKLSGISMAYWISLPEATAAPGAMKQELCSVVGFRQVTWLNDPLKQGSEQHRRKTVSKRSSKAWSF